MKTELLSPAKNKEIAFAAIDCGADAVYIGAPAFGARHNATNSIEDIKEVVEYAHKYWAKVFVTVNTIVSDEELSDCIKLVSELNSIGVDAIIVQDFGLLNKLIELNLPIEIHLSTQCHNKDIEKIDFYEKMGVKRAVLARELSIDQIGLIHKNNPNIELECFVHGALCVSYSGQCYLSQYIGGRSANRGECAQPCRKMYSIINEHGEYIAKDIYPLCLKDFNASNYIHKMIKSGVYSFKIEGRLKDINYVKNITAYYRQKLDKVSEKSSSGKSVFSFAPNPEKSFNRGFTDYFLSERGECYNFYSPKSRGEFLGKIVEIKKDCFRIKTNTNINPQDGLCFYGENGLEGFLVNKVEKNIVFPNKKIKTKIGTNIYRNMDVEFEKELSKPIKRQIGVNIVLKNDYLFLRDEDGVEIATPLPIFEEAKNKDKMNETFVKQFSKTGESDFYIQSIKLETNSPFMPVSHINNLRRTAFKDLIKKRIELYPKNKPGMLKYTNYYTNKVDYRANVHNNSAENFYQKCGCQVIEKSFESGIPNRQVELMRTKHCIKYALRICKSPQNLFLQDEKGKIYPLKFDCQKCEMAVLIPD